MFVLIKNSAFLKSFALVLVIKMPDGGILNYRSGSDPAFVIKAIRTIDNAVTGSF
jgi:hypothetical protein